MSELLEQQRKEWRKALRLAGITDDDSIEIALELAERAFTALEKEDDADIETKFGFGDYTRGIATITAVACYRWFHGE